MRLDESAVLDRIGRAEPGSAEAVRAEPDRGAANAVSVGERRIAAFGHQEPLLAIAREFAQRPGGGVTISSEYSADIRRQDGWKTS